jgi:hypothetical protein
MTIDNSPSAPANIVHRTWVSNKVPGDLCLQGERSAKPFDRGPGSNVAIPTAAISFLIRQHRNVIALTFMVSRITMLVAFYGYMCSCGTHARSESCQPHLNSSEKAIMCMEPGLHELT